MELRRYARRELLAAGASGDELDGAADMDALLPLRLLPLPLPLAPLWPVSTPSCLSRSSTAFGRAPCSTRGGRSDATEPDRIRLEPEPEPELEGAHASVSGIGGGDVATMDG